MGELLEDARWLHERADDLVRYEEDAQRLRQIASTVEELTTLFEPFVPYLEEWMKDAAQWPDDAQTSVFRLATYGQLRKARAVLRARSGEHQSLPLRGDTNG